MKRLFDICCSAFGLLIASPVLLPVMFLVWIQDFHSPFYIAPRVGKNMTIFKMIKLRSMIKNADASGVDSTSGDDMRITRVGKFIRKCKLDELTQLWNVFIGDMSLVGPRPNVEREVNAYTDEEKALLDVRPGITDISSIVFSDEGDILEGASDPDLKYNQVIRPWKSRLGLIYVKNSSIVLDIKLIVLTVLAIVSKPKALVHISKILKKLNVEQKLQDVCKRDSELLPYPPPGADEVVQSREV